MEDKKVILCSKQEQKSADKRTMYQLLGVDLDDDPLLTAIM